MMPFVAPLLPFVAGLLTNQVSALGAKTCISQTGVHL